MARKNVSRVVKAFLNGDSDRGPNGTVSTNGTTIFSYAMPIAVRTGPKTVVVSADSPSVTTSCHIGQVRYTLQQEGWDVSLASDDDVKTASRKAA